MLQKDDIIKALDLAIVGLPDGGLKSALQADTTTALTQLAELLGSMDDKIKAQAEPAKGRSAKRAKVEVLEASAKELEASITLLDDTLLAKAEAIMSARSVRQVHNGTADAKNNIFLSRFPPPKGWIEWEAHRRKEIVDRDIGALLAAAEKALLLCSSIAGGAGDPEAALAVFSPAAKLLTQALNMLEASQEERSLNAEWKQLDRLAARTITAMHASLKEAEAVARLKGEGAREDRASRWWLAWQKSSSEQQYVEEDALYACKEAIAARAAAAARLRADFSTVASSGGASLTALIAHDMGLLAPYAALAHLIAVSEAFVDEERFAESNVYPLFLLCLHQAAARQGTHHALILIECITCSAPDSLEE